jgi:cullin 1
MFQDIGLSREINNQFRHQTEGKKLVFDFEFIVQVLSTVAWPFSERNNLVLPGVVSVKIVFYTGNVGF